MKLFTTLAFFLLACSFILKAQDEGAIVKRERIDKNNGIFIGLGPSFTLGKNIGDYSVGFNIEAGFQKRLNRILSIGPSVSYLSFKYDPEVTNVDRGAYVGTGDPNDWKTKYGFQSLSYNYGYVLTLEGGDLSLISLALNLKLNFVPIKENSKFSVYGFAKPFVTMASRSAVKGSDERYTYEIYETGVLTATESDDLLYWDNLNDDTWYKDEDYKGTWGPESYDALKSDTEITGGIFIGPGIEIVPTNAVSFFIQAAFGYTFPITYVGTESYDTTIASYLDEEFPMTKKGFPSVNLQFGVSFNF
jgi:hypothetical protein